MHFMNVYYKILSKILRNSHSNSDAPGKNECLKCLFKYSSNLVTYLLTENSRLTDIKNYNETLLGILLKYMKSKLVLM